MASQQLNDDLYSFGSISTKIQGNRPPLYSQVLKVLYFNTSQLNMTIHEAAKLAIKKVEIFWKRSGVPHQDQDQDNSIRKLKKLTIGSGVAHVTSMNVGEVEKSDCMLGTLIRREVAGTQTASQQYQQRTIGTGYAFADTQSWEESQCLCGTMICGRLAVQCRSQISNINDGTLAHILLFYLMRIVELVCIHILQFLAGPNCGKIVSQSLKSGTYGPRKLRKFLDDTFKHLIPVESLHGMTQPSRADSPLATEPGREVSGSQLSGSLYSGGGRYLERRNTRGFINIMTEELLATLDYCHISHKDESCFIIAVYHALIAVCNKRILVDKLIVRKTSMNELRSQMREQLAERIKSHFGKENLDIIVVHWNGKLIPDNASSRQVDILSVLVSSGGIVKIFDVPALEDSEDVTQAYAINRSLVAWSIEAGVEYSLCDTCPAWFKTPLAIGTLGWDLFFIKELHRYESVNRVDTGVLRKISNHL
ncbi:hypothetical protein QAD02_003594 [Eretmocerus hayati]|uniref:Uncharacterized protein n=1 Tax=Eretmocerus hayati TaxID=131215 RepID=A0ACC2NMD7_9HYME|nr:hypothetical protein QAD02_003594 [Eretmocerus hayati]